MLSLPVAQPPGQHYPAIDQVVGELFSFWQLRDFVLPEVSFSFHRLDDNRRRLLAVRTPNRLLRFNRGGSNQAPGLGRLAVGGWALDLPSNPWAVRHQLYVGHDWPADREWFLAGPLIGAKGRGEPRRCLEYRRRGITPAKGQPPEQLLAAGPDCPLDHQPDPDPEAGQPAAKETATLLQAAQHYLLALLEEQAAS